VEIPNFYIRVYWSVFFQFATNLQQSPSATVQIIGQAAEAAPNGQCQRLQRERQNRKQHDQGEAHKQRQQIKNHACTS
jgi:hypothetical protein